MLVCSATWIGFNSLYQAHQCYDNATITDNDKICVLFKPFMEEADKSFNVLPTIIAFLMGVYVNMVCSRWWDQVRYKY